MKNYALVYLVDEDPNGTLEDVGNDPDFSNPPTWGICRPDVRNQVGVTEGSILLFVARVKVNGSRKYYLKGYFEVDRKIDVLEALKEFPHRRNVIVQESRFQTSRRDWHNKKWQELAEDVIGQGQIPEFLYSMNVEGRPYYQNSQDDHQVDNWKCRRVYNCMKGTFKKCVMANRCIREGHRSYLKENYVVGKTSTWQDWSEYRIEWQEVARQIGKPLSLMKGKRHPQLELTKDDISSIDNYVAEIIRAKTKI